MDSSFIEALSLMPRNEITHTDVLDYSTLAPGTTLKVTTAVTVVGYLVFGLMSAMFINGRAQGGRWAPEWYRESNKAGYENLGLALWWIGILFFWPLVWISYLIFAAAKNFGKFIIYCKVKRAEQVERAKQKKRAEQEGRAVQEERAEQEDWAEQDYMEQV
ncbi:hypothetical protein NW762_010067 [Fusarium torreyae]|uniref:Transmembrane protein n=1 Tax=Fusarium torreyae TaxID=1237075 RepID=A0A9W8RV83_9HYPO|nr:hypothetical protein NW762_010067 [Fusarium torreyae]